MRVVVVVQEIAAHENAQNVLLLQSPHSFFELLPRRQCVVAVADDTNVDPAPLHFEHVIECPQDVYI